MPKIELAPLSGRFWRMVRVPYQRGAFSGEGARRFGGRWNRPDCAALYLASDHATAILEFYQEYVFPGTLIACDVTAQAIADLTRDDHGFGERVSDAVTAEWARIVRIDGGTPPSWELADELISAGAQGALVPSVHHRGGTNLVLWRWDEGGGAAVQVLDPLGDLG